MNQLISSAVGEKLAALMTEDYLARASRGSRKAYDGVLRRVPDVPPEARDELPKKQGKVPARATKPRNPGKEIKR